MASKLFETFKKIPHQIPIFKKGIDKFHAGSFANYNVKFGKLDGVNCSDSDSLLNLVAFGNELGEIKIFGFSGLITTLFCNGKAVKFLKFLNGEGRLLAVNANNDFMIWEFNRSTHKWDISESKNILIDGVSNDLKIDISDLLDIKSPNDETLHVMLMYFGNMLYRQALIIGGKIHLYDEEVFSKSIITESCGLDKDYDLGDLVTMQFSKHNKTRFCLSFKNGLVMINELNAAKPEPEPTTAPVTNVEEKKPESKEEEKDSKPEETAEKKEEEKKEDEKVEEAKPEEGEKKEDEKKDEEKKEEEVKSATTENGDDKPKEEEKKDAKEAEKVEETKPAVSQAPKENLANQLSYIHVKKPQYLCCIDNQGCKKISSTCWLDNGDLAVLNEETGSICMFKYVAVVPDEDKSSEEDKKAEEKSVIYEYSADADIKISDTVLEGITQLKSSSNERSTYFAFSVNQDDSKLPYKLALVENGKIIKELCTETRILHYGFINEKVVPAVEDTTEIATENTENGNTDDKPAATIPESRSPGNVLVLLCEHDMKLIDLSDSNQNLTEEICPYFRMQEFSGEITVISELVKINASILPSDSASDTTSDSITLVATPLLKPEVSTDKTDEPAPDAENDIHEEIEKEETEEKEKQTMISVFATGHKDGSVRIWQIVASSVIKLRYTFNSTDIMEDVTDGNCDLLEVTSLQVTHYMDELTMVVGNKTGQIFMFVFAAQSHDEDVVDMTCTEKNLQEGESVSWTDSESVKLRKESRYAAYPNLTHTIQMEPPMPITSSVYQPAWRILGLGYLYGFTIVDLMYNLNVYSHVTLERKTKAANEAPPPQSMGQKLKSSMRQSFRKLKKLKPSGKHTYVVNGDKNKKEEQSADTKKAADAPKDETEKKEETAEAEKAEEAKPEEDSKKEEKEETVKTEEVAAAKSDEKTEETVTESNAEPAAATVEDESYLVPVEISRTPTDKSQQKCRVTSMLLVTTSLKATTTGNTTAPTKSIMKAPTLFVGTNDGTILVLEVLFGETTKIQEFKLVKELHLQHKAPILSMKIITGAGIPLVDIKQQIGGFNRILATNEPVNEMESLEDLKDTETPADETVGPSGDEGKPKQDDEDAEKTADTDAEKAAIKEKSVTMPAPSVDVKSDEADGAETANVSKEGRKSVDGATEKSEKPASKPTAASTLMSNLKKSGTLPASFLQALGGNTAGGALGGSATDQHELMVVSEEQVKLFHLPSLKAKSKYKVVDTGHHYSHMKSNTSANNSNVTAATASNGAASTTVTTSDQPAPNTATEENAPPAPTADITKKSAPATSSTTPSATSQSVQKISTIGLCSSPTKTDKWIIIVALTSGKLLSLSLHNLKKHYSNLYNVNKQIDNTNLLCSVTNGGLDRYILSHLKGTQGFQLTDVTGGSLSHQLEPTYALEIPDWSRPVIKLAAPVAALPATSGEGDVNKEHAEGGDKTTEETTEKGDEKAVNGEVGLEDLAEEDRDKVGNDTAVIQGANTANTHQGDVTMDSIKEYITNMDGNVTVKTFESSTEKHIVVDDGKIETTIHEKQVDDGQVVKDDVVKITSDAVGSN